MKKLITPVLILFILTTTVAFLAACSTSGSVGMKDDPEPLIFSAVAPRVPTKYPGVFLSKKGDITWAKRILDENPQAVNARDADGNTPLMRWVSSGDRSDPNGFGEFLVERGADLNARNRLGQTALMIAATQHSLDITNFLIAKGANVNLRDKDKETALTYAQVHCQRLVKKAAVDSSFRFQLSNECNECAIAIGRAGGIR